MLERRCSITNLQLRIERYIVGLSAADADRPAIDILVVQRKRLVRVCQRRADIRQCAVDLHARALQKPHLQMASNGLRIPHGKCVLPVERHAHQCGKHYRTVRLCRTCPGDVYAAIRLHRNRHAVSRLGRLRRQQVLPATDARFCVLPLRGYVRPAPKSPNVGINARIDP